MKVKELSDLVARTSPEYDAVTLGNLEYRNDTLVNKATGQEFQFSEDGFSNFAKYLTAPPKFLEKLSPTLQNETINFLLNKWKDSPALLSHKDDSFWNLHTTKTVLIGNQRIAEVIGKVFSPEADLTKVELYNGLSLNVTTTERNVEPRVGDVTVGGIRFYAPIGQVPYVSAYMERLVCANGMITAQETDAISIRGRTVNEIIDEMEHLAQKLMIESVPRYLENWGQMTQIRTENPEQLIHRLTREAGVSEKIESAIMERASALQDNTYYDIVNLITSLQHEEGVSGTQNYRLQALGGAAVRTLGGHRCNNCQHTLD